MFVQYGAVTSTIAVEIVVTTVIVNFFMTLKGNGSILKTNIPMRWFYTGMILYFTTCLQCAFQVTLTLQQIIHFTDWVVAHAHLVMLGVFGFWLLGVVTHLWPKDHRTRMVQPPPECLALLADSNRHSHYVRRFDHCRIDTRF